ncbi:MAG TPA: single-stranded DNA-binding protein [Solirubrobacteraceae bacterium]|nr:single-stranded DNA-binding protein [Solirubrobacteraceae bacterium]
MSVNRYICTGNLTKDPVIRELPSGESVCELRVAVDGMGGPEEPGFITVDVSGKPGLAAERYLTRGWLVAIDGRLQFGEWEAKDGARRHEYKVIGSVEFLSAPRALDEPVLAQPSRSRGSRREPVEA